MSYLRLSLRIVVLRLITCPHIRRARLSRHHNGVQSLRRLGEQIHNDFYDHPLDLNATIEALTAIEQSMSDGDASILSAVISDKPVELPVVCQF